VYLNYLRLSLVFFLPSFSDQTPHTFLFIPPHPSHYSSSLTSVLLCRYTFRNFLPFQLPSSKAFTSHFLLSTLFSYLAVIGISLCRSVTNHYHKTVHTCPTSE
jgi:hypothetical protein